MRSARRMPSSTSTASATRCRPRRARCARSRIGQEVSLAIETHVREDAIRLFGFTSEVERAWFRTLQTIQGVGAKVALAVLGTLSPQDLANAIALQNWAAVEQSPGRRQEARPAHRRRAQGQGAGAVGRRAQRAGRRPQGRAGRSRAATPPRRPSRRSPTSATSRRRRARPWQRPWPSSARRPIRRS